MGSSGASSATGLIFGIPYTAAVEEKMKCGTFASTAEAISDRDLQVLLR